MKPHSPTPAQLFRILSDETRLSILMLLTGHDELCVCELVETLHLSQPKISRHLALLKSSGLVRDQRQGQWVYYRLSATMSQWCRDILEASLQQTRLPPLNHITSPGRTRCAQ